MYRAPNRTTTAAAAAHHPGDNNVVVDLRKKSSGAGTFGRRNPAQESEALLAAISLVAVLLTVLTALVTKLWFG